MEQRNLILAEACLRANLALISQMSCSANQNHVALRAIVENTTPLLNDCREHIVARGLGFEAAVQALDGHWTEWLACVDGVIEPTQPTYVLLRSEGDVNISPASLAR